MVLAFTIMLMKLDETYHFAKRKECLVDIKTWMARNFLMLNSEKAEVLIIGPKTFACNNLDQRLSIPVLVTPLPARAAYCACLSLLTHLIQIISSLEAPCMNCVPIDMLPTHCSLLPNPWAGEIRWSLVHFGTFALCKVFTHGRVRNLGILFDSNLYLEKNVSSICKTAFFHLKNISKSRPVLSMSNAEIFIHAFITSRLDYCNASLGGCSARLINKLQMVQNAAATILTGTRKYDHISPILSTLHWLPNSTNYLAPKL